jgi:excisionase family DNA binding protein
MKILTTAEAAERLTVSVGRVHQLISEGRLPAQKLGRDYAIKEADLRRVADRKPGRPSKRVKNRTQVESFKKQGPTSGKR